MSRREVTEILGGSSNAADQVIRSLRTKGWLERAGWGRYLLVPADYGPERIGETSILALASQIAEPSWFAWGTAAQIHGLTTQYRWHIWMASTRHIRPRMIHQHTVYLAKVSERRAFGVESVEKDGLTLRVTDLERTLLDCIDKPDRAGGWSEVAMMISFARKRLQWDRLVRHAHAYDNVSVVQRLGWLADRVGLPIAPEARSDLKALIANHRSRLSPSSDIRLKTYDREWGLWINVPDSQLAADTPLKS